VAFAPSVPESSAEPSASVEEPPTLPEPVEPPPPPAPEPTPPTLAEVEAVAEVVDGLAEAEGVLPPIPPAPVVPSVDRRVAPRRAAPPAPAARPPAPASAAAGSRERAAVLAPPRRLSTNLPPVYPREARARGLEGVATLRVTIEVDGTVSATAVERSSGHVLLDQAAEDAARGWRFTPALADGVPVRQTVRIPVTFRLT
jgi:protein TonB